MAKLFGFSIEDTEEDPTSGSGFWMFATGQEGVYGFKDSNVKLRRIGLNL